MYATFHIRNHVRDHWFDLREGLWCDFTVKKTSLCATFWPNGRVRMQIFSWGDVSVCNLSHNFLCLGSTDMFPRSVSTTRRVRARVHTLKDRCLLTFCVTKSFLCVTLNIWHLVCHIISHRCSRNKVQHHINLRTLVTMQLLTYKDVSVCKLSHMRTCLFATCHKISNIISRPPCFHALCRLRDVFMCVFAH